jgi:hypothetical protein
MELDFLTIVLVLVGLAVAWTLMRVLFKLTARLFTLGCIAMFLLVGGIWLISSII